MSAQWPEDNECVVFLRAKTALGKRVVNVLQPLFPPGVSLDMEVCVREGNIRLKLIPLHKGEGWKDRSGG